MAKVTIRNTKQLSEHELKRELRKLRHIDPAESLQECIQELRQLEKKFGMSSIGFYQRYCAGKMGDDAEVMRWAGRYRAYLRLMQKSFLRPAKAQ
jgi:hypothetical protein